jgi:hypothetical protein
MKKISKINSSYSGLTGVSRTRQTVWITRSSRVMTDRSVWTGGVILGFIRRIQYVGTNLGLLVADRWIRKNTKIKQ